LDFSFGGIAADADLIPFLLGLQANRYVKELNVSLNIIELVYDIENEDTNI
jgi:hypothetical protein